jgi:uncharacterized membrane protein
MAGESRRTASPRADTQFTPERMGALTDGVFAIVLTLLVLELRLPKRDESVLTLMLDDGRVFAAWLISFLLLARFWLAHHAITAGLRQCHTMTLALNFAVLGSVSLVPFSADIVGTERISEPWFMVVFAVNVGLVSLSLGLLARHTARKPHLRDPDRPVTALSQSQRHHLYVLPLIALAASLLAFLHPVMAVGLLGAEFLFVAWRGSRSPRHAYEYEHERSPATGDSLHGDNPERAGHGH